MLCCSFRKYVLLLPTERYRREEGCRQRRTFLLNVRDYFARRSRL